MTTKTIAATQPTATAAASVALPVVAALFAGALLVFVSGFAQASILHDTAHDQRHAFAFPCH
jgi:cobalt transporter subunit CbtB